eukprot:14221890-Ditylum_brightwellii.AAC.1
MYCCCGGGAWPFCGGGAWLFLRWWCVVVIRWDAWPFWNWNTSEERVAILGGLEVQAFGGWLVE